MGRLALYGRPGAGKSTLTHLLIEQCEEAGLQALVVKLGAPLYELQALIHAMAGQPMLAGGQQDGLLLNDLGAHLRRINPDALTAPFAARVAQATSVMPDVVLVCDDVRAPDVEAVVALGFTLVEVTAPEDLRRARKLARGDFSAGADSHPTEAPLSVTPALRIGNDRTLEHLRARAAHLVHEVLR
ncbi:ATP-binding protein [Streptomyces sp. NPDC005722]